MNFSTIKLLFTYLHVLLFLILFTFPVIGTIRVRCLEKERFALLKIKADLKGDDIWVSEWGTRGTKENKKDCCRWHGVQCDNKTNHVVGLSILTDVGGLIPHHLGNLSMLRHLDLSGNILLNITDLDWLSSLHSLEYLDLSYVNLSMATTWMQVITNLPSLNHLNLQSCSLSSALPPSLPLINSSASLSFIDLSWNSLSTNSILIQFLNVSRSFGHIDFSSNYMMGKIPDAIGNLTFLSHVDLSINSLEGGVPTALWNSTMLEYLNLGENLLHDSLPNVLKLPNLEFLYLNGNGFVGSVSDLTWCTSLREMELGNNMFNGTLTKSIGSLSKLRSLNLGSNYLEGIINEFHLFNLSQLQTLDLSFNPNLTVKINSHWNPPFKLYDIILSHCNLGPKFPEWLLKANSWFASVDISNAQISDTIKKSIWDSSICFRHLNMSYNQISGIPPDLSCSSFQTVDLSSNEFNGSLPLLSQELLVLILARNKFSGTLTNTCNASSLIILDPSDNQLSGDLPHCLMNLRNLEYLNLANNFLSGEIPKPLLSEKLDILILARNKFSGTLTNTCNASTLTILDLSDNQLSGELPHCLMNVTNLEYLNLANNFLSGEIPKRLHLPELSSLHLRNNSFGGEIPIVLKECRMLHVLDLGENNLSGNIPVWIGTSLPNLAVLSLTSNEFYGSLPSTLCHLQNLQLLDLSLNKISGTIPKCIGNFSSMTSKPDSNRSLDNISQAFQIKGLLMTNKFYDKIQIIWKDKNAEYARNLVLLKVIDLSRNKFVGQIPPEVTSLDGLFALNISRNNLIGSIPRSIGQLELLNSLDLSVNNLSGHIPDTLSQLNHLGVLNLSFNNLSGKIPWNTHMQTFGSISYLGNTELCGPPLPETCPEDHEASKESTSTNNVDRMDNGELITIGFYISMVLGFIFGFWGVVGTLILNKSCRHIWFKMLIDVNDWLCVRIAVSRNRLQKYFEAYIV